MTVLATANRLNTCVGCSKRRNTSDSAARIHFLGAAGSVTGSRFLIEYASSQLLLEAGLFQGPRELRRRNWDDLPMPAAEIDAVAISHAHLDHCGGEEISVQAEIDEVEYFSVHADKDDVRAWLHSAVIPPKKIILVHGEDDARGASRAVLEPEFSIQVLTPGYEETLPL